MPIPNLVCRNCGHNLFRILKHNAFQCNRCFKRIQTIMDLNIHEELSDEQIELVMYENIYYGQIELIKEKIDKAIDERNEEDFMKYSEELKHELRELEELKQELNE